MLLGESKHPPSNPASSAPGGAAPIRYTDNSARGSPVSRSSSAKVQRNRRNRTLLISALRVRCGDVRGSGRAPGGGFVKFCTEPHIEWDFGIGSFKCGKNLPRTDLSHRRLWLWRVSPMLASNLDGLLPVPWAGSVGNTSQATFDVGGVDCSNNTDEVSDSSWTRQMQFDIADDACAIISAFRSWSSDDRRNPGRCVHPACPFSH
jgi:hypothetical protein